MKQKDQDTRQSNTYQTGATTPPKDGSGMIAILLVLVIFLAGLVSILSLLNIRMFSAFYETQKQDVPLSLEIAHYPQDSAIAANEDTVPAESNKSIGILGDPVTPVYQKHFQLPEGLFITHVEERSLAHRQGVQEGDVLMSLNGVAITQPTDLLYFLEQHGPDDAVTGIFYRRDTDEELTFSLKIEITQP